MKNDALLINELLIKNAGERWSGCR